MPVRRILLALFVTCAGQSSLATAQGTDSAQSAPSETEGRKDAAKSHYEKGEQFFTAAQYDLALIEFNTAQQLLPLPDFLFNIARCELRLGRYPEALLHLRAFLAAVPDDPEAPRIRSEIAELEARLRKLEPDEPPPAPLLVPRLPIYGISAAAATGVLTLISIGTLSAARVRYNDLRDTCAPSCPRDEVDAVRRTETAGYVVLGLALVGAAATAVLVPLELRGPLSGLRRPNLALRLSPGQLSLTGRF